MIHKNSFGQTIARGTVVGYANKTGSYTTRKIGVVFGFAERASWSRPEPVPVAKVTWVSSMDNDSQVSIDNLFVLSLDFHGELHKLISQAILEKC